LIRTSILCFRLFLIKRPRLRRVRVRFEGLGVDGDWAIDHTMFNIDLHRVSEIKKRATLGPLNHFLASTAYQMRAISIGPPYTKQVQFMSNGSGSLTAGKHNTGTIKATHPSAMNPHGRENLPRCQGPGRKLSRTKITRIATGRMNAIYCAMAPIEKIAPIATGPPKMRRLRRQPMRQSNQTCVN
jgi:hypothetical protein